MRIKVSILCLFTLLMFFLGSCTIKHHIDKRESTLFKNYQPNYIDAKKIEVSAHTEIVIKESIVQSQRGLRHLHIYYYNYDVIADSILAGLNQVFQNSVSFKEQRDLDVVISVHSLSSHSGWFGKINGAADIEVKIYDHKSKKPIRTYRKAFEKAVKIGDDYKVEYNRLSNPKNIIYQVLNQTMDEIKMEMITDADDILERLVDNRDKIPSN